MSEGFSKQSCNTVTIYLDWAAASSKSVLGYLFSQGKQVLLQVRLILKVVFFICYRWYICLDVFGPGAQSIICYRTIEKLAVNKADNKPFPLLAKLREVVGICKMSKRGSEMGLQHWILERSQPHSTLASRWKAGFWCSPISNSSRLQHCTEVILLAMQHV